MRTAETAQTRGEGGDGGGLGLGRVGGGGGGERVLRKTFVFQDSLGA